jgi:hypothetical protein
MYSRISQRRYDVGTDELSTREAPGRARDKGVFDAARGKGAALVIPIQQEERR